MKKPLVSIVIPVYNGANYLAQAIESALAQTYENIEVIVVNDGSKDDGATENVALSFGSKITYYKKENGGVSSALNFGIKKMRGDYFSWLSHDDLYDENKIKREMLMINSCKDVVICSGVLIDENGNKIMHYTKKMDKNVDGAGLFKANLAGYLLNGLGFLIPKSVFGVVGGFDESMRYVQDYDLWFRMMYYDYRFICIKDELVKNRVHKLQVTNRFPQLYYTERKVMANKHIEILINHSDFKKSISFLKLHLYLYSKTQCKEERIKVEEILKTHNELGIFVILNNFRYIVRGSIKQTIKYIYNYFLKLRGVRD